MDWGGVNRRPNSLAGGRRASNAVSPFTPARYRWRMSRLVLVLLMAASVCGCAQVGGAALRRAVGDRMVGDSQSVLVRDAPSRLDALPLAVAHCSRFGKAAQYASTDAAGVHFACVPKP